MSIWYAILNALGLPMFEMDFMKNALLAVLLMSWKLLQSKTSSLQTLF